MSTNQDADLVAEALAEAIECHYPGLCNPRRNTLCDRCEAAKMLRRLSKEIERLSAPLEVNDAMVVAAFRAYWGAIGGVDKRPFMTEDTMRATLNAALTERKA